MKLHCCAILAALLACWINPAGARVRQTASAIIVEAADSARGEDRQERGMDDDFAQFPFPFPFPFPLAPPPSASFLDTGIHTVHSGVLPSGTFFLAERACWTLDGQIGTCSSVRECYPTFKLPQLSNLETWVLGIRGTCNYVEADGRQKYGVCCTKNAGESSIPGGQPVTTTAAPTTTTEATTTTQTTTPQTTTTTQGTTSSKKPSHNPICGPDGIPMVPIDPDTGKPQANFPWWECFPFKPQSTTQGPTTITEETTSTTTQTTTSREPIEITTPTTTTTTTETAPTTPGSNASMPESVNQNFVNGSCGAGPYKTLSIDEQRRIVGGTDAVRNSWPFIGAMLNNGRQFCGCSLISNLHCLTAAHCIAHMSSWDVARLEVVFKMHSLKPIDPAGQRKRVRRVTRHKGFNARTLYNDIAILRLDQPVDFDAAMSPVCLPDPGTSELYVGKDAAVIGWGALKEGGGQPKVLQQVTVQIISNEQCKTSYGSDAPGGIVEHMLCAAYPGKDSCSGDSGGPLIVQNKPGDKWYLAGIVSWGIGCGQEQYPGVYTRVTVYLNWITTNTQ